MRRERKSLAPLTWAVIVASAAALFLLGRLLAPAPDVRSGPGEDRRDEGPAHPPAARSPVPAVPAFGSGAALPDPHTVVRTTAESSEVLRAFLAELALAEQAGREERRDAQPAGDRERFAAAAELDVAQAAELETSVDRFGAAMAEIALQLAGGAGTEEGSPEERTQARVELVETTASAYRRAVADLDGLSPPARRPPAARLLYAAQLPPSTRQTLATLAQFVR